MESQLLQNLTEKFQKELPLDIEALPFGETLVVKDIPLDQGEIYMRAYQKGIRRVGRTQYIIVYNQRYLTWLSSWKMGIFLYKINPLPIYSRLQKELDPQKKEQTLTIYLTPKEGDHYNDETYRKLITDYFPFHQVKVQGFIQSDYSVRITVDLIGNSS